ncbi:hypothetical protein ACWC5I_14365 [Kitasatospora sp. NPDC001574]
MHIAGGNLHAQLPHHLSQDQQNHAAARAANLLHASGYTVDLDPALGTPPPTTAFVPTPVPDPAAALAEMTHRLATGDNGYEGTAHLAQAVLGPDGALAQLATFTEATAAWSARLGHRPGDDLSDLLADSAATLTEITARLSGTATRITAMGSSWEPHRPGPRQAAATASTHTAAGATAPHQASPAPTEQTEADRRNRR